MDHSNIPRCTGAHAGILLVVSVSIAHGLDLYDGNFNMNFMTVEILCRL